MIAQSKLQTQTRGRPRKQQTRTLAPIYKQMFSDNSAIIHTSFLIYVFEVFVETKSQKRVGHKDGGFTMYDKLDYQYCFDNFQECLKQWDCQTLLSNQNMRDFVRLLPALGPKIILRQICKLINYIVQSQKQGKSQRDIFISLTHQEYQQKLNQQYPYMRFIPKALKQLRFDKNQRIDRSYAILQHIKSRVQYLWNPLLRIITHTVFNCIQGKIHNKYFKPFFSDADNPSQTYIGQLNLDQVVDSVLKQQKLQRSNRGSQANIEDQGIQRLRKVRSIVDNDGTRTVVQIIKAPEAVGGINLKQNQSLGLIAESPAKISRLNSQPLLFQQGGGFSSVFKPQSFSKQSFDNNEQQTKQKTFQSIFIKKQGRKQQKIDNTDNTDLLSKMTVLKKQLKQESSQHDELIQNNQHQQQQHKGQQQEVKHEKQNANEHEYEHEYEHENEDEKQEEQEQEDENENEDENQQNDSIIKKQIVKSKQNGIQEIHKMQNQNQNNNYDNVQQ